MPENFSSDNRISDLGIFKTAVIEAYGMTEATHQMTSNPLPPQKQKPGFVGIPAKWLVYEGGYGFWSRKHYSDANYDSIKCTNQKDVIRVVASKSHLNKETIDFIKKLGKETELIQAGSSLKFIKVAEGNADLYPRMAPTCEWDTAAAHAIVEGSGGSVSDDKGKPLLYGKKNILNPFFVVKGLN